MIANARMLWPLLLALSATSLAAEPSQTSLFRRRVAPILVKHCFSCHNNTDRLGDFSLQSAGELAASGYVEPGDVESSYLFEQLTPRNGKPAAMPKNRESLSKAEREAVRDWIAAGAVWPEGFELSDPVVTDTRWWSWLPLARPAPPVLGDASGGPASFRIRTPVDAFIAARLSEEGLQPSPEADRRTLIRRLYFDLLGLPPSPAEIDGFLEDPSPRAYEQLVDRLLESPHYGERWARHWLDVVKYADTCGYDKDKLRPNAWPYRDYVIRSFNDDKPYSRFVREQLAGDVHYPGQADGILGLGFIAAGPWDFIGHVEVPATKIDGQVARHIDRDEMVSNTLNTFASATIQCARCHNHKFDPFTQQHYYGLQSIFAAVDRAERPYDTDPEVQRRRGELAARLQQLQQESTALEASIRRDGGQQLSQLEERMSRLRPQAVPLRKDPAFGYHSSIEPNADRPKWVAVDLGRLVEIDSIVLRPCHDEFAGIGAGFGFPVRYRVEASADADFAAAMVVADRTDRDAANPGLAPVRISGRRVAARYLRVSVTRLARRANDFIFALAELQAFDEAGENVALNAEVTSLDSIEAPVRWSRSNLTDGKWAEAADSEAVEQLARAEAEHQQLLAGLITPARRAVRERLAGQTKQTQAAIAQLPKGRMVYAAATHFKPAGGFQPTMGRPRPIHILHRGNIREPREAARPCVLPLIPGEAVELRLEEQHTEGDRRAALAAWLTRSDNPLTWRSIVNRVWLHHFGRGLVATPNDFGRMGQLPTHPELLDWLACEFRDNGQSFKKLHKLLVTSSTYRQVSFSRADQSAVDGNNRFLWRMNRRRLEAEEVRDAVLAVSGKLDTKMYGPGFYLFKLERPEHSPHYEYHKHDPADPASHRRSIYRFVVRSQPDPFMTTLDCADSSQSTPQRSETVTSLQALSLLNNKFNLVMARCFADRLEAEEADAPARVQLGVRLLTGRDAGDQQAQALVDYARRFGLPNLCRVLFNLNEFVYID